jgi:hypothetical protein
MLVGLGLLAAAALDLFAKWDDRKVSKVSIEVVPDDLNASVGEAVEVDIRIHNPTRREIRLIGLPRV